MEAIELCTLSLNYKLINERTAACGQRSYRMNSWGVGWGGEC